MLNEQGLVGDRTVRDLMGEINPGRALMEAERRIAQAGVAGAMGAPSEWGLTRHEEMLREVVGSTRTVMEIQDERLNAMKGTVGMLNEQGLVGDRTVRDLMGEINPGKALMDAVRTSEVANASGARFVADRRDRRLVTPYRTEQKATSRNAQLKQRPASLSEKQMNPLRRSGKDEPVLVLETQRRRPHHLVGAYTLALRKGAGDWLKAEGLLAAAEELEAIDERLSCCQRVAYKHAADSTRRLLVAVADRVFPGRSQRYCDRWENDRDVGQDKVVNRILAFVDDHLRNELPSEEQRALGAELHALWRAVSDDIHRHSGGRDAMNDYLRLLRTLAVVRRASSMR